MIGELQAQLSAGLRDGAAKAQDYGERIITRLDVIAEGVLALNKGQAERAFEAIRLEAGESERIETKVGQLTTIEHVSAVFDGAGTVDIFVGSQGPQGFRVRLRAAAADSVGERLSGYEVPDGASIFAVATGTGANVNLQLKRERTAKTR